MADNKNWTRHIGNLLGALLVFLILGVIFGLTGGVAWRVFQWAAG